MMRVSRLTEVSEPALVDSGGRRHRYGDVQKALRKLEMQYRYACATDNPRAVRIAGGLAHSLAQRYTLLYLLDGQRGLLDQRGIHVNPN